jgi:hypothetical protein
MAAQAADLPLSVGDDQLRIGRQRIEQVFKYLQALHEHRNPAKRQVDEQPWRLWFDSLPDHPAVARPEILGDETDDASHDERDKPEVDSILSVERPKLSDAPRPPEELRPWLKPGWEKPENQFDHVPQREDLDENGIVRMVRFEEDLGRLEMFEEWAAKCEAWRLRELPARNAMKVFEQLYELHGQIEREAERYELVIGDGLVSWRLPDGGIFHPVLIRRVQLEFDVHVPRFRVVDLDKPTELYTALFSTVTDVDGQSLAQCRSELQEGDFHPLAKDADAFLKRFAVTLSSQGSLIDEGRPPSDAEYPIIGRSPVLFLRSRAQSFARAIEQLLSNLETRTDFCSGLLNIVGVDATATDGAPEPQPDPVRPSRLSRRDILFSKKANRQQEEIVQRLEHHSAVLVQGPPGTGKSHTIANLIGHLLANEKSVLVTSHTTKALRVLRGHVVDKLRPLCVSVLESDSESRGQLSESVKGITGRLNDDHGQLVREADEFNAERNRLFDMLGC